MSNDENKRPYLGEFVEPSDVRLLLHNAESEYYSIIGINSLDDERINVDQRLRAQEEFRTKPDRPALDHMDCANFMHMRTGLPIVLCVYYMFFLSESAGAINWPEHFDAAEADRTLNALLKVDFYSAVSEAVINAFVHPQPEWREFMRGVIDALIEKEDERRLGEARRLYDVINERQSQP